MSRHQPGTLRINDQRLELTLVTDDDRVVDVGLDIQPDTAHVIRHTLAAHLQPGTGHRRRGCQRPLIERALAAVGAASDRIEVHAGQPPRFVLVVVTPMGCVTRVDLDLVDLAELVAARRLPIVALGWPQRDWDAALRELRP